MEVSVLDARMLPTPEKVFKMSLRKDSWRIEYGVTIFA
jgi:hypothetical protein